MYNSLMNRFEIKVVVEVRSLLGKASLPAHSDCDSESSPSYPLHFYTFIPFNLEDNLVWMEGLVQMDFY
jgi:hypothetical protein